MRRDATLLRRADAILSYVVGVSTASSTFAIVGRRYCVRGQEFVNDVGLDQHGNVSVSFIVRIWLEEAANGPAEAVWRGSVTHVPSGEKRYFESLAHLTQHIALHLDMMSMANERDAGTSPMPEGAAREEG